MIEEEPKQEQGFWIVCRAGSELRATFRHPNEVVARKEAERLTREHGGKFYVFKCIGAVEAQEAPVRWTEMMPPVKRLDGWAMFDVVIKNSLESAITTLAESQGEPSVRKGDCGG